MRTDRVRALLAELTLALDELDAAEPKGKSTRKVGPRLRRVSPPDVMPSQEAIDDMARTLRRKGFG